MPPRIRAFRPAPPTSSWWTSASDIAESRLAGMQTIREFMDRRLTPARSTCEWATRRQDALSQRVSRISNLLRTRVEIEQQQSSQALLGHHEPAPGHAAQAAVHGGGPVGGGHHLLHRGLVSYLAKARPGWLGWPFSPESPPPILTSGASKSRATGLVTSRSRAPLPSAARRSSSSWPTATGWMRSRSSCTACCLRCPCSRHGLVGQPGQARR
jgi:hypothetical protein